MRKELAFVWCLALEPVRGRARWLAARSFVSLVSLYEACQGVKTSNRLERGGFAEERQCRFLRNDKQSSQADAGRIGLAVSGNGDVV